MENAVKTYLQHATAELAGSCGRWESPRGEKEKLPAGRNLERVDAIPSAARRDRTRPDPTAGGAAAELMVAAGDGVAAGGEGDAVPVSYTHLRAHET